MTHTEPGDSVLPVVEDSSKCNSYSDLLVTNNDEQNTSLGQISCGSNLSLKNPPEQSSLNNPSADWNIELRMDKASEQRGITSEAPLESCSPSPTFSELGTIKDLSLPNEPSRPTNPNTVATRKRRRSVVGNNVE